MAETAVVIVIPVYKNTLSDTDKISLRQLNKILGKYPRVFVAPESLTLNYGALGEGIGVERFADKWFQSVTTYSCLMMKTDFYERFATYEYMLLYQLDVFVFSDRLKEFCTLGYDYIGAPIGRFAPFWHAIDARVGNGGFSLRRIPSVLRVLGNLGEITGGTPFVHAFIMAEDIFFAYCGIREDIDFKVADIDTAIEFSVQENIRHIYDKIKKGWRPFGCHGWTKIEQEFWYPLIEEWGYAVPEKENKLAVVYTRVLYSNYMIQRRFFDMQPAWGWLRCGALGRLDDFFAYILIKYPEGNKAWESRLEELTLFWCAALEMVKRGTLTADMNREKILTAVYRAMFQGCTAMYIWEMWDRLLPLLVQEPYPIRDKIIMLLLSQKIGEYVGAEIGKIRQLNKDKVQMKEHDYNIKRQVRLQVGQKLFEKALGWNLPTDTEIWKQYTALLMKL